MCLKHKLYKEEGEDRSIGIKRKKNGMTMKSKEEKQPSPPSSNDADVTEATSEAGRVGPVDGDCARLAGPSPYLDHHHVLVRHPHHRLRRLQVLLSSAPVPCLQAPARRPIFHVAARESQEQYTVSSGPASLAARVSWSSYAISFVKPTDRMNSASRIRIQ